MRSSIALLLLSISQIANPGYRYEFPRDHFDHSEYETEWWYYTGNLHAPDGRRFGFELTFFSVGMDLSKRAIQASTPVWRPDRIYIAHLALTDIDGHEFYHTERMNRAGPGLAGVSFQQRRYWNGNWEVKWNGPSQDLQAVCDRFKLTLHLVPEKPPVINGQNGISVKGPEPGQASHYVSFSRLNANGTLTLLGMQYTLQGQAWMDHEFFTSPHDSKLEGWDWFAIQLDNHQELMLYRLRNKAGAVSPFSSGTYVDRAGNSRFLSANEFTLLPVSTWQSPQSHARYPVEWKISVPKLGLELRDAPALTDQELFSPSGATPSYWEGAVNYSGTMRGNSVHGAGYLEMTGYDKQVWLGTK